MAKKIKLNKDGTPNKNSAQTEFKGKATVDANTVKRKARMLEALRASFGIVLSASKACGVDRNCHYLWLKNDPEYKEAFEAMDNDQWDFVEQQWFKAIAKGDSKLISEYIKYKGKSRGFSNVQEIKADITQRTITVKPPSDPDDE